MLLFRGALHCALVLTWLFSLPRTHNHNMHYPPFFSPSLSLPNTHSQIGEKFYPYCLDKQNLTFPELQVFFKEEQQDKRADDTSYIASLVCDFVQQPGKSQDADQPSPTLPEVRCIFKRWQVCVQIWWTICFKASNTHAHISPQFVSFLFSKRNSIFNDECGMVYQNMDRPLSHYWIASSHNTWEI